MEYTKKQEQGEGKDGTSELEEKLLSIITKQNGYQQIPSLFPEYDDNVILNKLYEKTEEGIININSEQGKKIWKIVIQYYEGKGENDKVNMIYSRIGEASRVSKETNDLVWDTIFGFFGVASPEISYRLAERYSNWRNVRRGRKLISR